MRRLRLGVAGIIGGLAFLGASSAQAVTLLSIINPAGQTGTPFELDFTADAATTRISIGGYQNLAYEYASNISVTRDGGANLLGAAWTLEQAAHGSDAKTQNDGTGVPALWFGGFAAGYYDTFSQTFATTPNVTYSLTFDFTNDSFAGLSALLDTSSNAFGSAVFGSSAFLVTTNGRVFAATVPEPSTWAMMLLGFVGLGLAGYRRARKARFCSCS